MSYIGREPQIGNFQVCDAISVVNGQAAYTMQVSSVNVSPETANHMLVSLNGILQAPGSSYTVSGSTITFAANLVTGDVINFIHILGSVLDLGVPSDATVTTAKIVDANVTLAKLSATGTKDNTTFLRGDNTFATVSSDYVKLSSTTPSAANTFSIDGHFTSDYDIYKIYAIGMSGASMNNTRISMRVNIGGTAQTGTNHYYHTFIAAGTSVNGNWSNSTGQGHSDIGYAHNSSGSTSQANFEFTIFRPLATDKTTILHDGIAADNGSDYGRYSGFTTWKVGAAISGITLGAGEFGSGNIEADRILVYGLKI